MGVKYEFCSDREICWSPTLLRIHHCMRQEDLIKIRHSDMANRMGEGERECNFDVSCQLYKMYLNRKNRFKRINIKCQFAALILIIISIVSNEKQFGLNESVVAHYNVLFCTFAHFPLNFWHFTTRLADPSIDEVFHENTHH